MTTAGVRKEFSSLADGQQCLAAGGLLFVGPLPFELRCCSLGTAWFLQANAEHDSAVESSSSARRIPAPQVSSVEKGTVL